MSTDKKSLGRRGEDAACKALLKEKYKIIARNWRCRLGEIDIIAMDRGKVLCFIEVKARSGGGFGLPEESVTPWKQKRLISIAYSYMESEKRADCDLRFDVVAVDLGTGEVRIIRNAFEEKS
jgi:putative endonuclease